MSRFINPENIIESKRSRKPKQTWEPVDHREVKRTRKNNGEKGKTSTGRNRNEAVSNDQANRWHEYTQLIKRFVAGLVKETHYLELYSQSQNIKEGDKELKKIVTKIKTWKQAIISTMQAVQSENREHKRWPELSQPDEDDMVEVAHILCSACDKEETEENDIIFCDHTGCLRAYHQLCLQPQITLQDFDASQDWFCWQCECIDDCLDFISERLGEEYSSVQDLFPEIQNEKEASLAAANTVAGVVLGDDEDDGADDEYVPTVEDLLAEEEEWADAVSAQELSDNDKEDEEENEEDEDTLEIPYKMDVDGNDHLPRSTDKESSLLNRLQALSSEQQDNDGIEASGAHDSGEFDATEAVEEDGDEISELDSELEEDEVAGLLEDAAGDLDEIPLFSRATVTTASEENDPEDGGGYRRRLRDRSKRAAAQIIHVFGSDDVGRDVARIQRGVFITGTITAFALSAPQDGDIPPSESAESLPVTTAGNDPASTGSDIAPSHNPVFLEDQIESHGLWTITYRDGLIRDNLRANEIRVALELAREYVQRQEALGAAANGVNALQSKISALVHSNGLLSAENVLEHKREKKSIDYIALSMQMFGSLYDEDDERIFDETTLSSADVDSLPFARLEEKPVKKRGRRPSQAVKREREFGENEEDEEDVDPLGLAMATTRDEDYNSDDARRRRRKKQQLQQSKKRPQSNSGSDAHHTVKEEAIEQKCDETQRRKQKRPRVLSSAPGDSTAAAEDDPVTGAISIAELTESHPVPPISAVATAGNSE